jgi:hypothetical protein
MLIASMMDAGDYSASFENIKELFKNKDAEERVNFTYTFLLPDLVGMKLVDYLDSPSEEELLKRFNQLLIENPNKKPYQINGYYDTGEITWAFSDIEQITGDVNSELIRYFDPTQRALQGVQGVLPPESAAPAEDEEQAEAVPGNSGLQALPFPDTGVLFSGSDSSAFAPLRVNAAEGDPTYVKVYSTGGELVKTVFIKSSDSITFYLPKGSYILKYATGSSWYGEEEMFGENGIYQKAETTLEMTTEGNGYEITLQKVANGNLDSSSESKSGF